MFTKLMTIPDALIGRYYTLLTDLYPEQILQIEHNMRTGDLHPIQAKQDLAHMLTADFHSEELANRARENWSKQFQHGGVSDDIEEIAIDHASIAPEGATGLVIRVPRLLVQLGLCPSNAEAMRKLAESAVKIEGEVHKDASLTLPALPATLTVRLGKKAKRALIT